MKIYKSRKRILPVGWYPETEKQIVAMFHTWEHNRILPGSITGGIAAIIPHAGWFFSGDVAFWTLSMLEKQVDTVVLVGGHLPGEAVPVCYNYMQLETPLGLLPVDVPFMEELVQKRSYQSEAGADNTVEIQLPLVKYLFPESAVVALRTGADDGAIELGKDIYRTAGKLKRSVAVIGSTDLTHYGETYGVTPHGHGAEALAWVEQVNDKNIIEAMTAMEGKKVITLGNTAMAACSSGAAACALSFAAEMGRTKGHRVHYKTSYEVYPGDSFVGYAGVYY